MMDSCTFSFISGVGPRAGVQILPRNAFRRGHLAPILRGDGRDIWVGFERPAVVGIGGNLVEIGDLAARLVHSERDPDHMLRGPRGADDFAECPTLRRIDEIEMGVDRRAERPNSLPGGELSVLSVEPILHQKRPARLEFDRL